MTTQDFLQNIIYPSLATLIAAAVSFAVMYIRGMAATQKQAADATQLQQVLARGAALAKVQAAAPAEQAKVVTEYLHDTSPDLAIRTGMAVTTSHNGLAQTPEATKRIDATVAVANAPVLPVVGVVAGPTP